MKIEKINHDSMKSAYDGLLKTFVAKNRDYGNSFEQSIDTHGLVASIVRMEDKFNRLKSLVGRENEAEVASESLSDTLLDLANYATMTAVYLNSKKYQNQLDSISNIQEFNGGQGLFDQVDIDALYPKTMKTSDIINPNNTPRFAKFSSILSHNRVDPLFVFYKEKINTNYYFFPTLRVDDDGLKFFAISHSLNTNAVSFLVTSNQQYFVGMLNHEHGYWAFDKIVTEYPVKKEGGKGVFMVDSLKFFTNNRWRSLEQFGNPYPNNGTQNEFMSYANISVDHNADYPVYEDLNKITIIYDEKEFLYDIFGNYLISDNGLYDTYTHNNGLIKGVKLLKPKTEDIPVSGPHGNVGIVQKKPTVTGSGQQFFYNSDYIGKFVFDPHMLLTDVDDNGNEFKTPFIMSFNSGGREGYLTLTYPYLKDYSDLDTVCEQFVRFIDQNAINNDEKDFDIEVTGIDIPMDDPLYDQLVTNGSSLMRQFANDECFNARYGKFLYGSQVLWHRDKKVFFVKCFVKNFSYPAGPQMDAIYFADTRELLTSIDGEYIDILVGDDGSFEWFIVKDGKYLGEDVKNYPRTPNYDKYLTKVDNFVWVDSEKLEDI